MNGYSCGFRSVSKTKELIKEDIKAYKITIKERNKKKESISFSQVNLAFKDDGKLEGIKAQQKGYAWITALFQSQDYRDAITLTMDDTAFNDTYNNLNAFNKDMVVARLMHILPMIKLQTAIVLCGSLRKYGKEEKTETTFKRSNLKYG